MDKPRIQYPEPGDLRRFYETTFDKVTEYALRFVEDHPQEEISSLLSMLEGIVYTNDAQSREGATFKSLSFVAHLYSLSKDERQLWYGVAKELPLSQAHVSYIARNILERNRIFSDLDKLVKGQG